MFGGGLFGGVWYCQIWTIGNCSILMAFWFSLSLSILPWWCLTCCFPSTSAFTHTISSTSVFEIKHMHKIGPTSIYEFKRRKPFIVTLPYIIEVKLHLQHERCICLCTISTVIGLTDQSWWVLLCAALLNLIASNHLQRSPPFRSLENDSVCSKRALESYNLKVYSSPPVEGTPL